MPSTVVIHLADVSEFQGIIDWPTYGRASQAVIVRAHSGYRVDHQWNTNRDGARANVRIRGWYQYLARTVTPETQAAGFCNAVGSLRPGEFVVVDLEEGDGDQTSRAHAWMAVVDQRLNTRSWLYTGESFARTHLGALVGFADRNVWVANYRSRPPGLPCTLWQHTDAEPHAGIRNPCDCSIYQGTADQLAALVGVPPIPSPVPVPPPPPVVTFPEDHMQRIPVTDPSNPLSPQGTGFWDLDGGPGRPRVTFDQLAGQPFVNGADGTPAPDKHHSIEAFDHGGIIRLRMWGFEAGAVPLVYVPVAA